MSNTSEKKTRLQQLLAIEPLHYCPNCGVVTFPYDEPLRHTCGHLMTPLDSQQRINWALYKWQQEQVRGVQAGEQDASA